MIYLLAAFAAGFIIGKIHERYTTNSMWKD